MFTEKTVDQKLTDLLEAIGQPKRLKIMLVIGDGEACVCHIEAVLGLRQATISQHLMVLRDSGLVLTNRKGRNIFYRLSNQELSDTIKRVAVIAGLSEEDLASLSKKPVANCLCPDCNPGIDPKHACHVVNPEQYKRVDGHGGIQ